MDWMQLGEIVVGMGLVVVTFALFIATHMYRKATDQMAKIQQEHVDLQEKNADDLKQDNAIKLIEAWDAPALQEARSYTREIAKRRPKLSDEELLKEIEGEQAIEGLKESLIHVFNFWERVRLSIESDRADEDILKQAFRGTYLSMYERFKVWLDKQPHRYRTDLEKLYERWRSES